MIFVSVQCHGLHWTDSNSKLPALVTIEVECQYHKVVKELSKQQLAVRIMLFLKLVRSTSYNVITARSSVVTETLGKVS